MLNATISVLKTAISALIVAFGSGKGGFSLP